MTIFRRPHGVLVLCFALSACATVAPPPATPEPVPAPVAENGDLPRVALDAPTLYSLLIGEIAGQQGQVAVAAVTLGRVAQDTRDPRVAERATLAALYARSDAAALRNSALWVELQPQRIEAREARAAALLNAKQVEEARQQFEKLLELAADNPERAYMRIAATLGRYPDRAAAIALMQELAARHPRLPGAHFASAHLAVRGGDFDRALVAINQTLSLRPEWEEAALLKARILVSQKEPQRAQQFYESFLASNPRASAMRVSYARYLIEQRQWEAARAQFERVVADDPRDSDAVYALGLLFLQTGKPEQAEEYLRRTLELRPDNDQARLYLGQAAENRKQYEEASRWYRSVGPGENYFEAQARLAVILANQGDVEGARYQLHRITAENDQQRAQLVLAEEQILRDAKRYEEAYDVLTIAVAKLPDNNDLLYARALVAEKLNRLAAAEVDLKLVIKRDPKNAHALNALGYTLADRTTRLAEAQEYLGQALALKPDDPFILDSYGWLQYRLGNIPEAIRYLKRALELRSDAEISAHLGEVLWVSGAQREAESVWDRALKETPNNEALLDAIKKFKR